MKRRTKGKERQKGREHVTYLLRLHLAHLGRVLLVVEAIAEKRAEIAERAFEGVGNGLLLALRSGRGRRSEAEKGQFSFVS